MKHFLLVLLCLSPVFVGVIITVSAFGQSQKVEKDEPVKIEFVANYPEKGLFIQFSVYKLNDRGNVRYIVCRGSDNAIGISQ